MTRPAYRVSGIAGICDGKLITTGGADPEVRDLLIDSRRLVHAPHALFIALKSDRNDGHLYIPELYEKGIRAFLISDYQESSTDQYPGSSFIIVGNTLDALQRLGAFHRSRFSFPVVGITGSNGKTIVKEWLFQMLCNQFRIIRSPKSYNSQVGVPLSVWKMEGEHTLGIFEAGISRPGEMERLERIIRPDIGIITNIGHAHDEHFHDQVEKTQEKLKLFSHARVVIYCSDHEIIRKCAEADPGFPEVFTWSRKHPADLQITHIITEGKNTRISATCADQPFSFTIPFTDEASVENAIHCAAAAILMERFDNFNHQGKRQLAKGNWQKATASWLSSAASLTPVAMRLELREAINHCTLINDSYNSDINSLGIALDFLDQQGQGKKKTIILSDILQTGRDKEELYREIAALFTSRGIGRIIGIGRDMMKYGHHFGMEKAFYTTTEEFLGHFPLSNFQHETILLKGARIFEFERISQVLQQKAHETVMEVNLDAMIHNLNFFRSGLKPGTRTMAMVKAFSYGSGSYEIANVLQFHRVDYLAVAYADEGVELRKAGIHLPIMVMSPEAQSMETLLKYNLEPEIYNLHILRVLEDALEKNVTSIQQEVKIHIKLDTGMHRLGFMEEELDSLIERLRANQGLYIQSVFSHLASGEDPADDAFTLKQIGLFKKMSDRILQTVDYPVLRHIANSAATRRFPTAHFDMVRLGIGLYGVGHNAEEQQNLRNVSTLRTVITQIKSVPAGETIGYNRQGKAAKDMLLAILPIGYADGLNRRLGNGNGEVYIHGKPAPVVGNICMDLTMVDVTGWMNSQHDPSHAALQPGTPVVIFDDAHPVTELAGRIGTIPYEVLTSISRRVKRVYFYE